MEEERKGNQVLVSERTVETRQNHVVLGINASTHGSVSISGETNLNYATTINNYGNLYALPGKTQTDRGIISVSPAPIRPISGVDAAVFESRETIFNEIIDTLKGNQFNMIGIWGMGGIGKTTLAIKVAEQAKTLFDAVVMATVSHNPNWRAIQGQIADKLGLELKQESNEGRADQLFQDLQSKKSVLIILDDIWESFDLYNIGVPFGSQHKGCKVIVISRNLQVCQRMGSQKNLPVKLLRECEADDLFRSKAGDYDDLLEKVFLAKQIIKECGGLPLAIAIVAAGLRGQDMPHWKDMANRLHKSDMDKKVIDSIELSFDILPEEAQRLFLLSSLFPEDYNISIKNLWLYGLGLNFFEKVGDAEAALTRVEALASTLKSSCLLLEGEKEETVKMHDVVRDAALEIASKRGHVFLTRLKGKELSKFTAISFVPSDILEAKLPDKLMCPLLEILILNFRFLDMGKLQGMHKTFFTGLKKLTLLQISGMEFVELPQSLECLENLQALCFDDCKLADISRVGRLNKLIILSIYNSDLKFLPKKVGQLPNLRVLIVNQTPSIVVKCALQNLSNLEALSITNFFEWKDASLGELVALSHLNILEISILSVPVLPSQLPFEKLSRFLISVGLESRYSYYHTTLALDGCHKVALSNLGINRLMKKVEFLSYREMLGLGDILLSSNLHGGGVLKKLEVERCNELEYISSTKNWDVKFSFPSLHELYLWDLSHLKEIFYGNFVTLNNLTYLKVYGCHQLGHIFTCTVAKSLSKIQTLEVVNCNNVEVIFRSEEETLIEVDLPQLRKLVLEVLPKLKCLDSFSIGQERLSGDQVHCPSIEMMNKFKEKRQSEYSDGSPELENLEVQNYGGLFHSNLVTLGNLTDLEVVECDQLQYIITCTVAKSLSKIQTLKVKSCKNLEVIFRCEEETSMEVDLPQLSKLVLRSLPMLKCLGSFSIVQGRLSGEQVHCPSSEMTKLKEKRHSEYFSGSSKLKNLKVQKYVCLFHGSPVTISNLTHLEVDECHQLQYIFTRNGAKSHIRIQTLRLHYCNNLEVILFRCEEETLTEADGIITFPQLTDIQLIGLPNFKGIDSYFIFQRSLLGEQVQRPSLEVNNLKEKSCSKLFSGFPKLRILQVRGVSFPSIGPHITLPDSVEEFYLTSSVCPNEEVPLHMLATSPRLRKLVLRNLSNLQRIEWNIETYQNLEILTISGCKSLTSTFFEDHTNGLKFPSLWNLSVSNCHKMFQFASQSQEVLKQDTVQCLFDQRVEFGALKLLTIDSFYVLEQVHAIEGPPLFLFSRLEVLELYNLHNLKHLWWNDNMVKDCTHEHLGLLNLCRLEIRNCGSLRFVFTPFAAKHFGRLKVLSITNCEMMEEIVVSNEQADNIGDECEPCDHIVFPSLTRLHLNGLPNLQGFYMGKSILELPHLSSEISIIGCPKMKVFCPRSPLMPQLGSVELDDKELRIYNKGLNNMLLQKFHQNKQEEKKVFPTWRCFGCFGCFDNLSSSDED